MGSSQADRGVNCGVDEINEVQLSIFKDHKELGVPSMVIVTPVYGLDHLISHKQSGKQVCIKYPPQLWHSFPGVSGLVVKPATHSHRVPRLRICAAIHEPPPPICYHGVAYFFTM